MAVGGANTGKFARIGAEFLPEYQPALDDLSGIFSDQHFRRFSLAQIEIAGILVRKCIIRRKQRVRFSSG